MEDILINFSDIEQQGFFIYEGILFCKMGPYGVGINLDAHVFKKLYDSDMVQPVSIESLLKSYKND